MQTTELRIVLPMLSTLYAIMHVILGHCLGTRRNSFVLLVPVCLRDQKNSQWWRAADGDSWIMSGGAKSHFTWFSTYLLTFSPLLGDALQDTPPALSTYLVCRSRNAIPTSKCFFCLKLQNGFELNFPCEGVLFREG